MKRRQKIRKGIILISFFLFPAIFFYMSPYLIVDATIKRTINGSFIIFSLLFVSSLILGRAFCGWVCPAAGCQEAIFPTRSKRVTKGNFIKWLIWVPWIAVITIMATKSGGYEKVDFFYRTSYGFSIGNLYGLITYLFVLLLIVAPAFIVGKRAFCHHICWMAPFMILGRKLRNIAGWQSLQLLATADSCTHCHTCTTNCPMSLPVEEMVNSGKMESTECILCGTCIDGCKNEAIRFAAKKYLG